MTNLVEKCSAPDCEVEKCSAPDCNYKVTEKGAIDYLGRKYCGAECADIVLSKEGKEPTIDYFNQIGHVEKKD